MESRSDQELVRECLAGDRPSAGEVTARVEAVVREELALFREGRTDDHWRRRATRSISRGIMGRAAEFLGLLAPGEDNLEAWASACCREILDSVKLALRIENRDAAARGVLVGWLEPTVRKSAKDFSECTGRPLDSKWMYKQLWLAIWAGIGGYLAAPGDTLERWGCDECRRRTIAELRKRFWQEHESVLEGEVRRVVRQFKDTIADDDKLGDLHQVLCEHLLRKLDKYHPRPGGSLAAWAHEVLERRAITYVKQLGRTPVQESLDDPDAHVDIPVWDEDTAEARDVGELLHREIAKLPQRQQQALILRYQGASAEEIALTLGTSEGAAHILVCRARAALRDMLGERLRPEPAPV